MANTQMMVDSFLYGAGSFRRFVQDSAIWPDVWARYLDAPSAQIELLLAPWLDTSPFEIANVLRESLKNDGQSHKTTYNRTLVVSNLTLKQVLQYVVPLTYWYHEREETDEIENDEENPERQPQTPTPDQLWEDVIHPATRQYPDPKLLPMVRMAGIISYIARHPEERPKIEKEIDELSSATRERAIKSLRGLSEPILDGWRSLLNGAMPDITAIGQQGTNANVRKPRIYAVNCNRAAVVALRSSVKAVKGDAAKSLFSIRCNKLIWAIVDSGIDATHPAFMDRSNPKFSELGKDEDRRKWADEDRRKWALRWTRVKETYDFGYLRELLLGITDALPDRLKRLIVQGPQTAQYEEMVQRVRSSRAIDWELLRPLLQIQYDSYVEPKDGHGTHVAGILAADWPRGKNERMYGMCPDINLIDIRICRDDGASDEFVVMSALQFIQHLNANADYMVVQGVNMSLSLLHDAANYACGLTPVCIEAERTVASGIVVVAAAGNLGYRRFLSDANTPYEQFCAVSITDPGNAEAVLTVGSTHRSEPHSYGISYFSSRGPTGDGRNKPDLVAPGEKIFAPTLDGNAIRVDGTSMAAPHVSGAAAMLMARHAELIGRPDRIKKILCSTATDLGRERYFQGSGLVDVLRAIQSV